MIPEILRDNTTIIKDHTIKSYIFCVLLRIAIGLSVITDKLPTKIIIILAVFVVIAFSYKFYKLPNVWKVYLRTVLVYFIVLILSLKYNNRYNNISGTLIIVDALMGLQSRHIFDRIGLLL